MGKKRRCGGPVLLPEVCLIRVLVWLPVLSLLRFKRVCRSWCDLIETSPIIDLYFNSCSSSKFGSFILHAAVDFPSFRHNSLLMLSSVSSSSESDSNLPSCVTRSRSWYSVSFGGSCDTGSLCGKCDYGSCCHCKTTRLAEDDDQVVDTDDDDYDQMLDIEDDDDDDQVVDTEDNDEQVVDIEDNDEQVVDQVVDTEDNDEQVVDQVVDTEDNDEQVVDQVVDTEDNDEQVVDDDDQVVDNNNYLGGGGGGGVSNDNDGQQQKQQLVLKVENLGFPLCYNKFDNKIKPHMVMVVVVGSCDGLICLHDSERRDVSLWNPVTGQFRILPKSLSSSITIAAAAGDGGGGDVHRLFAFGFDVETYDYKVVLLSFFNRRRMLNYEEAPMECICQVEVYSSRTNSWKLLKGITSLPGSPFPYPPDSSSSSELFYLNGCCFFMAKLLYYIPPPSKNQDRFIISLDLTNETVTPIGLPSHNQYEQLYLCYLRKKIALFAKKFVYNGVYDVNDPNGSWESFCICVFNDESWTRVHFFRIKLGLPGERYIPRGISNDGVFALLETEIHGGGPGGLGNNNKKKMKLYNLVTQEVKKNFLSCDQVLSKAYAYKPSLFWITAAAADDMVIA